MSLSVRDLARFLVPVLGVVGMSLAINRWLCYRTLLRFADARLCGNCFLAAVGVLIELGLLGMFLLLACVLNVGMRGDVFGWCCVSAGILLTPAVLGVPVFAFGYLVLVPPVMTAALRRTAALLFGT